MGISPNDPRYQQLIAEIMRTGGMQSPTTMNSQISAQLGVPSAPVQSVSGGAGGGGNGSKSNTGSVASGSAPSNGTANLRWWWWITRLYYYWRWSWWLRCCYSKIPI